MRKYNCEKMRKSSAGSSKMNGTQERSAHGSASIGGELEILALKAKNDELIKAHAKLTRNCYELKTENINLRKDMVILESKFKSQEYAYNKLVSAVRKCAPSFIEISNILINLENDFGLTPKVKAVTQPVKPHTVNGTVLMSPTISLTRMVSAGNGSRSGEPDSSVTIDYRNSSPSTSYGDLLTRRSNDDDHSSGDSDEEDVNVESVIRESHLVSADFSRYLNPDSTEGDDYEEDLDELADESSVSQRRLSTVHEESHSSTGSRNSVGEVRIYLSRLSNEDMEASNICNNTRTSIEASVNDNTYLNIETTLIENQSSAGNRLRTDIMLFSPRGNSTRLDSKTPRLENEVSDRTLTSGDIQCSIVTPSCSDKESSDNTSILEAIPEFPTPSLSIMGDIDKADCSRLAILEEEPEGLSPVTLPASIEGRKPRSRSRRFDRDRKTGADSSPLSTRSSNVPRRTTAISFVSCQRGGSVSTQLEKLPTPTVVLEKLEDMAPHLVLAARVSLSREEEENEEPKQNVDKRRAKSSKVRKTKSKSRSPSVPAKRTKINDDATPETVKDIRVRLSNFVADLPTGSLKEESTQRSVRPQRAAKPKVLKEPSLTCKLRRLV